MDAPLPLVIGIDGGATYSHGVAATLDGRVLAVVRRVLVDGAVGRRRGRPPALLGLEERRRRLLRQDARLYKECERCAP